MLYFPETSSPLIHTLTSSSAFIGNMSEGKKIDSSASDCSTSLLITSRSTNYVSSNLNISFSPTNTQVFQPVATSALDHHQVNGKNDTPPLITSQYVFSNKNNMNSSTLSDGPAQIRNLHFPHSPKSSSCSSSPTSPLNSISIENKSETHSNSGSQMKASVPFHCIPSDQKSDSSISTNYCSSPELSSPIGSTLLSEDQQSFHRSTGLAAGLHPAFYPALHIQSLQHSLRHLHQGLQGFNSLGISTSSSNTINRRDAAVSSICTETAATDVNTSFDLTNNSVVETSQSSNESSYISNALNKKRQQHPKSPLFDSTNSVQTTDNSSPIAATPHGIEHILSRPIPRSAPIVSASAPQQPPGTSFSPLPHPSPNQLAFPGVAGLGLNRLSPASLPGVYWPSLPSFIGNPTLQAWRDRLSSSGTNLNLFKCNCNLKR